MLMLLESPTGEMVTVEPGGFWIYLCIQNQLFKLILRGQMAAFILTVQSNTSFLPGLSVG